MDDAHYQGYQDAAGEWRWRLVAENGRIVGDSGEGYTRKWSVKRAVRRLDPRARIVWVS